jgi:hypothetical protein
VGPLFTISNGRAVIKRPIIIHAAIENRRFY